MKRLIEVYGTALVGGLMVIFFMVFVPGFASLDNVGNVLKDTAFLAILALGFTLALIVGELDLSVAESASLASVVAGWMIQNGYPVGLVALATVATGALVGVVNGLGVTALRVPSLIMTLGLAAVAKGLSYMVTGGVAFVGKWPQAYTQLGRASSLGLPNLVLWLTGTALAAWWLVGWTRTGAHMTATGEVPEAARLAGIRVPRIKTLGLTLSGALAGLTALLLTSSLSSAAPNMAGDYLLYAIASVLLGMTMFTPGKPNVVGTVAAAVILKMLGNGLILIGAPYYMQDIVLGLVIVLSVALSASTLQKAAFP